MVCLTEMALLENENKNFKLRNYDYVSHRCRDSSNRGGGVGLFVRKDIFSNLKVTPLLIEEHCQDKIIEASAIGLKYGKKKVIILGVYRSPNDVHGQIDIFLEKLSLITEKLLQGGGEIIITGDLNICWLKDSYKREALKSYVKRFNLKYGLPLGTVTRVSENCSSALDIFFTNITSAHSGSVQRNNLSDHFGISMEMELFHTNGKLTATSRKFTVEGHEYFEWLLSQHDWSDVTNQKEVNQAFHLLKETVQHCYDMAFPETEVKTKQKIEKLYLSQHVKQLKSKLTQANQTYYYNRTQANLSLLKGAITRYKSELKNCQVAQNLEKIKNSDNKQKALWGIINSERHIKGKNQKLLTLSDENGHQVSDPHSVANILNNYFIDSIEEIKVKTNQIIQDNPMGRADSNKKKKQISESFFLAPTCQEEIMKVTRSLNKSYACGPDGLSCRVILKNMAAIAEPLTYVTNLSLETAIFPDELKIAKIVPVFKDGNEEDKTRYRPLAINSVFSKVIERIFLDRLLSFCSKEKCIADNQFGFQKCKSTKDALILAVSKILDNIDNKQVTAGM